MGFHIVAYLGTWMMHRSHAMSIEREFVSTTRDIHQMHIIIAVNSYQYRTVTPTATTTRASYS